jgi:hypothetical protein
VVRRVRLREDLKPLKAYWHPRPVQPDWLFITHVTGLVGQESFDLQGVKVGSAACEEHRGGAGSAGLTGYVSFETLRIAKGQAHADVGVEYVEWEPCNVEITTSDASIDWGRALPSALRAGYLAASRGISLP